MFEVGGEGCCISLNNMMFDVGGRGVLYLIEQHECLRLGAKSVVPVASLSVSH